MPELYQIAGAILRDVSQARYMSDMYSRQISFAYENDSLLRRFPVPRAEIEEVEFNLHFLVTEVKVDPNRHHSRNAAIGRIFDDYSLRIVRAGLEPVNDAFEKVTRGLAEEEGALRRAEEQAPLNAEQAKKKAELAEKRTAADRFQKLLLSDDYRSLLHGRLLRYLNENAGDLLKGGGPFNTDMAMATMKGVIAAVTSEPVVIAFEQQFGKLDAGFALATGLINDKVNRMAADVNHAYNKYSDYSVEVDISPQAIQNNPLAASYIKVKAAVKNYRWSKVDVDPKDMRNIRSLAPE